MPFLIKKHGVIVKNIHFLNGLFQSRDGLRDEDVPDTFTEGSAEEFARLLTLKSMRLNATNHVLKEMGEKRGEPMAYLDCEVSPNDSAGGSFAKAEDLNLRVILHVEGYTPIRLIHFKLGEDEVPVCHWDAPSHLPVGTFSLLAIERLHQHLSSSIDENVGVDTALACAVA